MLKNCLHENLTQLIILSPGKFDTMVSNFRGDKFSTYYTLQGIRARIIYQAGNMAVQYVLRAWIPRLRRRMESSSWRNSTLLERAAEKKRQNSSVILPEWPPVRETDGRY